MRFRNILATGALATVAVVSFGSAANAYTIDAAGKGFVGKGEVQSAFGWNNAKMQTNHEAVTFKAEQPTTQSLSQEVTQTAMQVGAQAGVQTASQTGTQSATQVVSQDLTCTFTNGNATKVFHRDGVRDGERTGTRQGSREGSRYAGRFGERTGTREGSQAGVQKGNLASALSDYDRKTGQWTGWFLKGFGPTSYTPVSSPVWDAPTFDGDFTFGDYTYKAWDYFGGFGFGGYNFGDYAFENVTDVEWGEWDAAPGENPADCLRNENADKITQISNVITPGAITEGLVVDGPITEHDTVPFASFDMQTTPTGVTYGAITKGAVSADGPAKVFAVFNNVSKALNLSL